MKKFSFVPLALAALLSACSGSDQQTVQFTNTRGPELIYSYPYLAQQEVPTHAPVVLRFSEALTNSDTELDDSIAVFDENGQAIKVAISTADDGRSLVLTPASTLAPKTRYTIEAQGLTTASGAIRLPGEFTFTTRAATEGPASQVSLADDFNVARMIPDGTTLPIMDFSTLRLQFSQPLDQTSLIYGETLRLETAQGDIIPASVIAQGHYLSIDPMEDLKAGRQYKLVLTEELKSTLGKSLVAGEFAELTFIPKDSHPREVMVQKAGDSEGSIRSILTGELINAVPVKALLLGESSTSQQQGDIFAELAFVPNYPEVTPLRIPRGSLLVGSSVDVVINGKVPAGHDTGNISVTFVSDANGFLLPNRYSTDESAPRHIQLYMDLAMTTEHAKANSALSQDLLHVELAGTAIVQNGVMVINAVGVVEPKVLGLETAYGTLSFHMEAYADQENAPVQELDRESPFLLSWVPGEEHINKQRPGDPIILNFNEPLDRASLEQDGAWELYKGNNLMPKEEINWRLDGGSLIIEPKEYLQFGTRYRVELTSLITDLSGNPLIPEDNPAIDFTMVTSLSGNSRAPLALTVYPGFPCVLTGRDLTNGVQGRCDGGKTDDDLIPVSNMPADRSIVVRFSQDMNPNSIRLGSSFKVELVNTSGTKLGDVPGQLKIDSRSLTFTPDEPWIEGQLYRYVLASRSSGGANCSNGNAICSKAGHPLQTAFLKEPGATAGGPNMEIYFKGVAPVKTVFNPLWNLPTLDVNANLKDYKEEGETQPVVNGPYRENTTYLDKSSQPGVDTSNVNVGCKQNVGSCPGQRFMTMMANLDTEVMGPVSGSDIPYDDIHDAVHVKLYPTALYTSSINVHAKLSNLPLIRLLELETPTGPQMMRMRYQSDAGGKPTELIDGYIYDNNGQTHFRTTVETYLDAPYLKPIDLGRIELLSHNLRSYPLELVLDGPITFFEDGRMQIEQRNLNVVPIQTKINLFDTGLGILTLNLEIPKYGVYLNYTSKIIKD